MTNQAPEAPKGLKATLMATAKEVKPLAFSAALHAGAIGLMSWLITYGLRHAFGTSVGWFGLSVLLYFSATLGKVLAPLLAQSLADGYHSSVRHHEATKAAQGAMANLVQMLSQLGPESERTENSGGAYL